MVHTLTQIWWQPFKKQGWKGGELTGNKGISNTQYQHFMQCLFLPVVDARFISKNKRMDYNKNIATKHHL